MRFSNLTIGKKIASGFGAILTLVIIFSVLSFFGINTIVHKAKEVIAGNTLDATLAQKVVDHLTWTNKLNTALVDAKATQVGVETDDHKCGLGKWLYGEGRTEAEAMAPHLAPLLKDLEQPHSNLHQTAIAINTSMGKQGSDRTEAVSIYLTKTLPALSEVQGHLKKIREQGRADISTDQAMLKSSNSFKQNTIIGSIVTLLVGLGLALVIVRGSTKLLAKVADDIKDNAAKVTSAAASINTASQDLARNASSQAAAMEQTATALEESTAMSQQTSDLTAGSQALMNQNIEKSGQTLKALVDLTRSMAQIEQDSDKIRSIINTIGSIAFQTNLLALNAAVEAARAGEAGAGFAVVADEVKNLANRTAEAARTTQQLLDDTISRVTASAEALKQVNTDFDHIVSSATGIGEKTSAITEATHQQANGLVEISKSSQELEQITVSVQRAAQTTAEAAEQLTDQAEEMGIMVADLVAMVYGKDQVTLTSAAKNDVTCWEIKNCPTDRRNSCPAYPEHGGQCWMVTATLCGGQEQGSYHEKMTNCKKCNVYLDAHGRPVQAQLPNLRAV
ncbi:MAG: CZB domain-containing protein [Proteobacteria bacterium]|nr:CZB domain-containing protein [Pseudomonadota bacterium]MDP2104692.1 methyl-accepting chemotaxis protein [Desulfobulbaceae bacterium]